MVEVAFILICMIFVLGAVFGAMVIAVIGRRPPRLRPPRRHI